MTIPAARYARLTHPIKDPFLCVENTGFPAKKKNFGEMSPAGSIIQNRTISSISSKIEFPGKMTSGDVRPFEPCPLTCVEQEPRTSLYLQKNRAKCGGKTGGFNPFFSLPPFPPIPPGPNPLPAGLP